MCPFLVPSRALSRTRHSLLGREVCALLLGALGRTSQPDGASPSRPLQFNAYNKLLYNIYAYPDGIISLFKVPEEGMCDTTLTVWYEYTCSLCQTFMAVFLAEASG